jgi:uncharacterized membrane protein HdeD (DUF308 family)
MMMIDRLFIAFMTVCGLATAGILVFFPQSREFRIAPYFWVLIAMAIFEGIAFARNRGAPGAVIAMESRVIGFVVAIALMLVIPYLAGLPLVRLF